MDITQKDKNLRIVRGNAFALQMEVTAMRPDGSYIDDFRLDADAELYVSHGVQRVKKAYELVGNATIVVRFNGTEALGPYDFSMCGTFEGEPWRWSVRKVFTIVEHSYECWLPKGTVLLDDTYFVGVTFSLFSAKQQSDWQENDSTSLAFIRNKPKLDDFATKDELLDVAAALGGKQDVITDITAIRSGAQKGESAYQKPSSGIPVGDLSSDVRASIGKADTALQSFTESDPTVPSWAKQPTKPAYTADEVGALPADTPLFSGSYDDLEDKPTIPFVPTNVSAFTNDAGYLTQHQDISGKADKADTYTKGDVDGLLANKQDTISDLTAIRSGAQKGESAYQKPVSGIPANDLSSDVRTSLGKADTALQSFTESDPTVPSWAKQPTKPAYTADEVGALPADTPLFSGSYDDLEDKPTIPVVPTNVSAFTNDAGYLTQHQDISGKADKTDTYTKGDVDGLLADKQDTISDLAVIRSGASAGSTAYQKPLNGIPAADIESGVIPTVDYPVTDVRMPNGSSVVNNKVAAIPNIYVHNLVLEGDSTTRIYTTLITLFSNSFDVNSLIAYINNLNYPGGFMCSGTVRTNSSGIATGRTACRLVAGNSAGTIGIIYHDTGDSGTTGPIYYSAGTGANKISNVSDAIVPVLM